MLSQSSLQISLSYDYTLFNQLWAKKLPFWITFDIIILYHVYYENKYLNS